MGMNLVAVMFLAAVTLLFMANFKGRSDKSASANAAGGQNQYTNIRVVVSLPSRIMKLLDLSPDQKAQLQAVSNRFQKDLVSVEQENQRAFSVLQKGMMNASFDEGAVKQRQGELVAANAKRVQVHSDMLAEMRKVFTSEQLTRLRPELPIQRNDLQLNVQLPEGFSSIGLSNDQQSQLLTVVRSREQKMIALSVKEKAARTALEQAIFAEPLDEAAKNQRREELIAIFSEQVELNTGIMLDARKILTPDQLKHLDETTLDQ